MADILDFAPYLGILLASRSRFTQVDKEPKLRWQWALTCICLSHAGSQGAAARVLARHSDLAGSPPSASGRIVILVTEKCSEDLL